jgi:hypothetical protein
MLWSGVCPDGADARSARPRSRLLSDEPPPTGDAASTLRWLALRSRSQRRARSQRRRGSMAPGASSSRGGSSRARRSSTRTRSPIPPLCSRVTWCSWRARSSIVSERTWWRAWGRRVRGAAAMRGRAGHGAGGGRPRAPDRGLQHRRGRHGGAPVGQRRRGEIDRRTVSSEQLLVEADRTCMWRSARRPRRGPPTPA